MTTGSFGVGSVSNSNLGGSDTTQQLQKLFTGRTVGSPAFPYGALVGTVVSGSADEIVVNIQITDQTGSETFTFTCIGNGSPDPGTEVLVVFPANGDHTPWIVATLS